VKPFSKPASTKGCSTRIGRQVDKYFAFVGIAKWENGG